jgi:hypothetical protein
MNLSLQDWLENGRLGTHKSSSREIADLLRAVDRDLADAQIQDLSADRRFAIAYSAALLSATAALAASGYRAPQEGHHYWTIRSLAFTMQIDDKTIRKLNGFRKKRNITDYEMIGMVSKQEVDEMISLAQELRAVVEKWLRKQHPDLMEAPDADA